jgi:hypothetical protein
LTEDDPIRPNYYTNLEPEPIAVIEAWHLDFHLGNTVKYIARAGKKNPDALLDLEKARWYLDRKITQLQKGIISDKEQAQT